MLPSKRWMILMLSGFCVSSGVSGQRAATHKFEINRFFMGSPRENSGCETGPLHVVYSDGDEVVQTLPPLKASTNKDSVFNAVGFSGAQLAEDRRALGWTIKTGVPPMPYLWTSSSFGISMCFTRCILG